MCTNVFTLPNICNYPIWNVWDQYRNNQVLSEFENQLRGQLSKDLYQMSQI